MSYIIIMIAESYEAADTKFKNYVERLRHTADLDVSDEELGGGTRK